jgi:hypothetical protein
VSPAGLFVSAEAKLEAAGRRGEPAGQAALILAARIEAGVLETGSSLASMVREFRATLTEALKDGKPVADPVEDELEAARERKRSLAEG